MCYSQLFMKWDFTYCFHRYVEIGSKVNQFDSICEVQSDKVSAFPFSQFDEKD